MKEENGQDYVPEKPGGAFYFGWIAAVIVAFIATGGLVLARELWIHNQTAERENQLALGRRVLVTPVLHAGNSRNLRLPGDIHGYIETPVYAKIPGYMKTIYVDKGDRVKKGQVLAILSSPETDRQVDYAKADLHIKTLTNRRFQDMVKYDAASQQQADQALADMLQAQAALRQLEAIQQYEQIRADFDGLVTARNMDPGAMITQTTASTGATPTPVVMMATLSPLRIYAYVPQSVAPFIKNGDHSSVSVYEYPNRAFEGTVTRNANALASSTRTMQVEVDLPNADQALLPGMYATVEFSIGEAAGASMVPDDSLIFKDGKTYVPVVKDNKLHLAEVTLGYDNGIQVQITQGLKGDEMVGMSLGQAVQEGETVQPVVASNK